MANPKLRFKADDGTDFPEWRQYKLGNLGSFKKGKGLSKDQLSEEGNPCILYGQLYTNYNEVIKSVVSKTNASLDNAVLSEGNEVLFPNSDVTPDGIACASYLPFANVILGGDISVFKCNEGIRGDVLSYIINSPNGKQQIYRIAQGTTVIHTSASSLSKILVNYPSSQEEQRKIADFLSTFDDKVEAKEQQLEALQETKKGLLQQIFSQQLRFKADDGTEFPDWKQYKLGNLGSFKKGKGLSKDQLSEEGTPCILYGQLYTDYSEVIKSVISKTNASLDNAVFSEGNEVLLPCSGETSLDISRATFLPIKGVALGGDLHVITCNSNINGSLLSYIINSSLKKEIARIAQGATVVHTSASSLSKILVNYPSSLEEQRKIAEFLGAFDEKIEAVKRQLEALKEIKKGLLQQMFV